MNVLLAEDDPNLGILLQEYLTVKGYKTELATDGNEGLDKFMAGSYDICILDVMMPKKDGFALAKEIRMKNAEVPIVFLTAKAMKEDTLQGFRAGADDYMTKPFEMEELIMRMQAIMRRVDKTGNEVAPSKKVAIGKYVFDTQTQVLVYPEEGSVKLTTKEAGLLELFSQNKNKPVSRSFALKLVWGDDTYFNARSMDVYITKLRKHLKKDSTIKILNLHGEGFKLIC
jgi:DNA-binding response OmpR family regulator